MNIRLVAALVVAILIAHAIVIHLLLKTSTLSAPKNTSPNQDEVFVPPEPIPVDNEEPSGADGNASAVGSALLPEKKPFQWRPLNYAGAVQGRIASIPLSKSAGAGILVDLSSRKVLWCKNPRESYPIASMSKIMTQLLAYEIALDRTRLPAGLDTEIPVTREATEIPPSKVYLMKGEVFTLRDLLIAASVKSANDCAYLIAQHLGGGKAENFVGQMNEKAARLGMRNTKFFNPNGLPGKTKRQDNYSSPEDMVRLCEAFMQYPDLREWSSKRVVEFRKPGDKQYMKLYNHNNLLPGAKYGTPGVSGIKTGFTNRAGYCVAVCCSRNGVTLLAVITGYPDLKGRDTFGRALLNWGFDRLAAPRSASR